MESTELAGVQVQTLSTLDADSAAMLEALVADSGWNQTRDDWEVFARLGTVHVIRDVQGSILASGAVLPMDPGAAWISMILVKPGLRAKGLGRKVFEQCLRTVQGAGRVAMLDATPAGQGLYAQFAFTPQWKISRWQRAATGDAMPVATQGPARVDSLAALDTLALGLQRHKMLSQFAARPGAQVARHAQAFCFVRAGRFARHIGPMLAPDEASATQLLRELADTTPSALLIDVPDDRPVMHRQLAASGFERIRNFTRMSLGDPVPRGQLSFIHAIAGPEYG